jgi:hypothetical protein
MSCPNEDSYGDCRDCISDYRFDHPEVTEARERGEHYCGCNVVADDGHPFIVACIGCGSRIDTRCGCERESDGRRIVYGGGCRREHADWEVAS